ncbi:MAG: para-aminobenzoate synthetase / 4-amino-4-deoxychorismate lyase [Thermoleophilaceae bacterium]|nr:para-aminobenzoate synthetase / 4-amino-4-deoxychorismate lyase [Thermoleophilaceae bacterium]
MRVPLDSRHTPQQALLALRDDPHPFALVGDWAGGGAVVGSEPTKQAPADADPFATLDRQPELIDADRAAGAVGGGWFGYLGYRLGSLVERLPPSPPRPVPMPAFRLAFYDHLLRLDAGGGWWFEALSSPGAETRHAQRLELLRQRLAAPAPEPRPFALDPFVPRPGRAAHAQAVRQCREYIAAGDIYQANLCIRMESRIDGAGIDLFARASAALEPPWSAYFGGPWGEVASLSPELFIGRAGREVVTRPIKGTTRREAGSDGRERAALAASAKDLAENVMIVDLMRNDLGRTAAIGSVRVPAIATPEAHPGVWHLVSEVRATLPRGVGDGPLVRHAFPPGSVTGAPKIKAMEIIATLESTGREAYTGAIGFASPVSGTELNVAIRTFELSGGRVWLGAGGGIVADSDPEGEYDECLDKARPLIEAAGGEIAAEQPAGAPASIPPVRLPRPDPALGVFETVLVLNGSAVALDEHLTRLAHSARELYAIELDPSVHERARAAAANCERPSRLRIRITPAHAEAEIETDPLRPGAMHPSTPVELVPIVVPGGLGPHKWNDRRIVDSVNGEALIVDLTGEVLETGAGAIVAVEGRRLLTPPADGRILRSVTLRTLRAAAPEIREEPLTLERLVDADELLVLSSIRGVQRALIAP